MGQSGVAHEIAAGPEGSIYVIAGTKIKEGGYTIMRWAGD